MTISGVSIIKKYLGQIIFNIIAAGAGVYLFSETGILSSTVMTIAAIIALMTAICAGNYYFVKQADSGRTVFQPEYVITEQTFDSLNDPQSYIEVMKDLRSYPQCRQEAIRVIDQWETFKKKSVTLNAISYSGGVYEVVNQDVESVMLNNMILFMKRAAIMQSSSKGEEMSLHRKYLREIVARNDKILGDYTNLLIEASQLNGADSANAEIKSLDMLIQSIKDYRKEIESGDIQ